ncbi:D-alanyl-D-alanine carboxypeptidase family protein [Sporomusa termitida]|uniref:D-alanyl-D-alanine carboxypeptidase DacB n=1 Tax=Sporomusa termitida TaxID=2377 RepID=A0A517DYH9_9FIRM|nr:D-alanyl-D-alanine carboxypeptidase family protein [Sporomusa termitida]QDR82392.1 D-alanyl-D-alanine carboxypeptidase DacB [Sporomusa termitida]
MRRQAAIAVFIMILGCANGVLAAVLPQVEAEAAVVMRAGDKRVLYAKNLDNVMYPASTTKIMTLITALEQGDPDSVVVVSPAAAGCEGSSLELRAGDRLTLRAALYGLMLVSGNDAAEAVAENVAGSVPAFVRLMNDKADQLGTVRTQFSNPHGLPDPNHFTTAYDLALMTAYGLQNPVFASIVSTREYDVHFVSRSGRTHARNTNKLLGTYTGANGVKTGFTNAAGECLVAAAKRNGVQLIAVVLNSDKRWEDATRLLNYGFQQLGL